MSQRPTYGVTVEREDQLWTAVVDGLPSGVFGATDTEHFADLEDMVRDLIATLDEIDPGAFDLTWRYVQGVNDYTEALQQAQHWTDQLHTAEVNRDGHRAAAAAPMTRAGLSQRTIGEALGISHQRVGQILNERNPGTSTSTRRAS